MVNMLIVLAGVLIFLLTLGCATKRLDPALGAAIRAAAARVLPPGAEVDVQLEGGLRKPALVVSAHLLEGHQSDEANPYVKGDYGTHEKLTRLVRLRASRILKAVLSGTSLPKPGRVAIRARHGVRRSILGAGTGGQDVALTIYALSVPTEAPSGRSWEGMKEEEVLALARVEQNIIPSLTFQTGP